ncbi:hypothetical protein Nepgr_001794 [Nepenthes gracilis]|uniref:Phosphoglycolate phosphatase n=1 Tax=Nepenthes gracilis TaxID=150966 RepID=A0AAD3P329_NEPGR|nr:hypothetical protein Nepgr_001794 [Nepenthes gracilis]
MQMNLNFKLLMLNGISYHPKPSPQFPTLQSHGHRFFRMASNFVSTRASTQPLKNAGELIDSMETFILDCDGVLWKGDKLIDGVPKTLDMLRSKGKRLIFVTNNSRKSRRQHKKKFDSLGISISEDDIFPSYFAAASYLKSINFSKHKKVYVIGEDGIFEELELAGFQCLGGPVYFEKNKDIS